MDTCSSRLILEGVVGTQHIDFANFTNGDFYVVRSDTGSSY